MSQYTITIKQLSEMQYHFNLDLYPIFDEVYRQTLNDKILSHYWFEEIGFETPDRFNHYLALKMAEIMPYYNQLYKSELLTIDPLNDFETKTIKDTTGNEAGKLKQNDNGNETGNQTKTNDRTGSSKQTNSGKDSEDSSLEIDRTTSRTVNSENENTTTNNLQTESTTHSTGTGHNTTKGNKNNVFSDTPPNEITIITNPDGSVTTTSYATTTTNDSTTENADTNTTEDSNGTVNNTGTVKNSGSTNETANGTEKDVHTETKNINYGKIIDETSTNNDKEDISYTKESTSKKTTNTDKNYSETNTITYKGHTKSQSELLLKYRETFLNIDMMIIEELSSLFMQIY